MTAPSAEILATWVVDAADRVIELVDDLTDEQLVGPLLPTINPLIWEIGHIAWFQEKFVLRQACGHDAILPFGDAIYDSGAIPHDTRWRLNLPSRAETVHYVKTVARRVADTVVAGDATDVARHFARYTVHHHDTHTEALTYTRQTLGMSLPLLRGLTDTEDASRPTITSRGNSSEDAKFSGGRYLLGALMSDPFAYDNEKWAHPVDVDPFAMSKEPVTQSQFLEFVRDGGYRDPTVWADGGAWLAASGAECPAYWRHTGDGCWQRRHFDRWVDLEPDLPVSNVSWWEADAFARWAGRRLPSEAEWEFAAAGGPAKSDYPWGSGRPEPGHAATDWRSRGPVPVSACPGGDSQEGCRQLIGNVWEWTASDFVAYPNFERDAYHENSEQFFGERKVLRGGSWATRGRYVRAMLRNYFTPERRDVFAGFRTCSVG